MSEYLCHKNFQIKDLIRYAENATFTSEYNCDLRRIYPWEKIANTKRPITEFGLIWVEVKPGTIVDEHDHDEEETFLIISGNAEIFIEGQKANISKGDVVYIPRFWTHQIKNPFEEKLIFVDIYWDWKGRQKSEVIGA